MSEKSNGGRPGTSSTPVQRLTTWKAPRDLTLAKLSNDLMAAAVPASKKTFMPNLNVQRKKTQEPTPATKVKKEIVNTKQEKGRFDRKKKDAKAMIQTTSVFSEGIAASEKKKFSTSYYGDGGESKANLPPPKLNLERNKIVDKSVDEKSLQKLLRDDFINDDFDEDNLDRKSHIKDCKAPIQLPLVKTEPKTEDKKKLETSSGKLSHLLAESELLETTDEGSNRFLFFQFPDSIAVSSTTSDNKETASHCMKEISSGRLGTIQMMKSGKVRLVQGDKSYVIAQSTNTSFLQDVVSCSTDAETKTGTLTSLGPVMSRFLVTPDWDTL